MALFPAPLPPYYCLFFLVDKWPFAPSTSLASAFSIHSDIWGPPTVVLSGRELGVWESRGWRETFQVLCFTIWTLYRTYTLPKPIENVVLWKKKKKLIKNILSHHCFNRIFKKSSGVQLLHVDFSRNNTRPTWRSAHSHFSTWEFNRFLQLRLSRWQLQCSYCCLPVHKLWMDVSPCLNCL